VHESKSKAEVGRGDIAMQACNLSWYCKGSKNIATGTLGLLLGKGLSSLFRDYYSYAAVVDVVKRERSVGVPPRRLFRYDWMHISVLDISSYFCT
jgi:hypothetical protein